MSLISDPNFLIHSIRLNYLRNVEDPYGPRLISLSPSYANNPYILTSSLADIDRWPELAMPSSPAPSDDEESSSARPGPSTRFGARGLRHTQTIMGPGRTGALGMRVNGRRASNASQKSLQFRRRESAASLNSAPETTANTPREQKTEALAKSVETPRPSLDRKNSSQSQITEHKPDPEPVKQPLFIPKFKGAAEMEARRRQRMQARAQLQQPAPVAPPQPLNPDFSSSEDETPNAVASLHESSSSEDGFDELQDALGIDSDEDDFDPDFAAAPAWGEGTSLLSSETDLSASFAVVSPPPHVGSRRGTRLSPVHEGKRVRANPGSRRGTNTSADISMFEMVTPLPPSRPAEEESPLQNRGAIPQAPALTATAPMPASPGLRLTFPRQPIPEARSQKSALTAMLASSSKSASTNPFMELYGAITGRGATAATTVRVYFPDATDPAGQPMDLNIRADATVEEVLGFALWSYWEEGWQPRLEIPNDNEERVSAVGWILRIAEDDGEPDEDFPPPDRMGKIAKFRFGAYAVLKANAAQVNQNLNLEAKIVRRPSRIMLKQKKSEAPTPGGLLAPPVVPGLPGTPVGSHSALLSPSVPSLSTSLGPSSSFGPQSFLKIHVGADSVHVASTIPVTSGMYMQEVLELVCRKRKIANPNDYAFVLDKILVPLDRTVASLQGKTNLELVKRSLLPEMGIDMGSRSVRTTDPNASIFKRMSEVPDNPFVPGTIGFSATYKKYNVVRKMSVLGRHERILAIDGVYVYLMPAKARVVFENARTMSWHIKSIAGVTQSKSSSTFKLLVQRDSGAKRYDFEAESPKLAAEIVTIIKGMKSELDRKGTLKSRRSRQVV